MQESSDLYPFSFIWGEKLSDSVLINLPCQKIAFFNTALTQSAASVCHVKATEKKKSVNVANRDTRNKVFPGVGLEKFFGEGLSTSGIHKRPANVIILSDTDWLKHVVCNIFLMRDLSCCVIDILFWRTLAVYIIYFIIYFLFLFFLFMKEQCIVFRSVWGLRTSTSWLCFTSWTIHSVVLSCRGQSKLSFLIWTLCQPTLFNESPELLCFIIYFVFLLFLSWKTNKSYLDPCGIYKQFPLDCALFHEQSTGGRSPAEGRADCFLRWAHESQHLFRAVGKNALPVVITEPFALKRLHIYKRKSSKRNLVKHPL